MGLNHALDGLTRIEQTDRALAIATDWPRFEWTDRALNGMIRVGEKWREVARSGEKWREAHTGASRSDAYVGSPKRASLRFEGAQVFAPLQPRGSPPYGHP
eukprot:CAMPEP_0119353966 /NCGR_PEP_ID=MMETSP1334-20130426/3056_1 /TAXON_ID=127549 /ORGANISM="Calcidiscus leptoporus, Strain RCC1130" /LENGTH=100 /DNA_ID=CAMNT_0007367391 /DNA_START=130 /DNA_END=428 /DNA_ORIENTATION=+